MKINSILLHPTFFSQNAGEEILKYTADPDADVFYYERGGVIVIGETEKMNLTSETLKKYSMVCCCKHQSGFVTSSESKAKLINIYAHLLASETFNFSKNTFYPKDFLKREVAFLSINKLATQEVDDYGDSKQKILNWITLNHSTFPNSVLDVQKYATDINAEVYPFELCGFVVIGETEKLHTMQPERYSMVCCGQYDSGVAAIANTKKELIDIYKDLQNAKILDIRTCSSTAVENLKNEIEFRRSAITVD